MHLLRWAFDSAVSGNGKPWPAHLPRPTKSPPLESHEQVATEVMLCALAFLLHHELAHRRLSHAPVAAGCTSIDQERDADYEAAAWILGTCGGDVFDKRALGVTVALAILVALRIHMGSDAASTHPRSFDRLINTLDRHVHDPNHICWGVAIIIFKLHMDRAAIAVPEIPYDTCRAVAEAYADMLAARSETHAGP